MIFNYCKDNTSPDKEWCVKTKSISMEQRERDFKNKVNTMISFPYEVRKEFIDYWTEPNKSGTKMRFELEKTWDLSRRLHRWANTHFGNKMIGNGTQNKPPVMEPKSTIKEIQQLDELLAKYSHHPTSVKFEEFGKWFDYLKSEKLMKQFTKGEVQLIKDSYSDNEKCRCACVQLTFNEYVKTSFTFSMQFELRDNLNMKIG